MSTPLNIGDSRVLESREVGDGKTEDAALAGRILGQRAHGAKADQPGGGARAQKQ